MKERPILFSAPMVRAIVEGRKTQTRMAVKLPHNNPLGMWAHCTIGGENGGRTSGGETISEQQAIWHTRTGDSIGCPYGQPGDMLWVREAFCHLPEFKGLPAETHYKADNDDGMEIPSSLSEYRWKPSIHMPRWAARLLEVVPRRACEDFEVTKPIRIFPDGYWPSRTVADRCANLVNSDRRAAADNAAWWLKTYCRHWATVGHDTQTLDNLNTAERVTARQHMGTLRRFGLLREGGFRGNFEVMPCRQS